MPQSPAGHVHHQQVHTSRTRIPPGWLLELARLNQRSWVVWLSDLSRYWHILLQQGTGRSRSNWRICCQNRRKKWAIKLKLWLLCFTRKSSRLTTVFRKKETCRLTDKTIMRSCNKLSNATNVTNVTNYPMLQMLQMLQIIQCSGKQLKAMTMEK